jgi:fatty acid desaturase
MTQVDVQIQQPESIDRDVLAAVAVNYPLNLILCLIHVASNVFVLFVFPLYLLPRPGAAVWAVVAVSCSSNGLFSVLHEAIHRSLAPVARLPGIGLSLNDLLGRLVGICFGSPFDFVACAHLTHHQVNRTRYEHVEVYDDSLTASERRSFMVGYYFFLLGGLYKAELFVPMILWLPRRLAEAMLGKVFPPQSMADQVIRKIYGSQHRLRAIRLDALAILVSIGVSASLYRHYWWILCLHFMIRALLISFLDYTYHYDSPLGDRLHGYNLKLPRLLSVAILHFNYHGIHHRFPALPWRSLTRVFRDQGMVFDNNYLTQAVSQLKGPLTREALQRILDQRKMTPSA